MTAKKAPPVARPNASKPGRRSILKAHSTLFELLIRALDPLLVVATGWIAHYAYFGSEPMPETYWLVLLGVTVLCIAVFPLVHLYEPQRGMAFVVEVRKLVYAWALVGAFIAIIFFATKSGAAFSRVWTILWLALGFTAQLSTRIALRQVLRYLRHKGLNQRHIAVVGAGSLGREIVERLQAAPWSGYSVRGLYDDDLQLKGSTFHGVQVLGDPTDLARDIDTMGLDQVWIALPLRAEARIRELLTSLQRVSVQISFVPDIHSFHLINHSVSEVAGFPVINLTDTPLAGSKLAFKAIEDFVLSAMLLLILGPLLLHPGRRRETRLPRACLLPAGKSDLERNPVRDVQVSIDAHGYVKSRQAPSGPRRASDVRPVSARFCAERASMNYPNSSMYFGGRCRWSDRDRSGQDSSKNSVPRSPDTCRSTWSRPASRVGRRSMIFVVTPICTSGSSTIFFTSKTGRSGSICEFLPSRRFAYSGVATHTKSGAFRQADRRQARAPNRSR